MAETETRRGQGPAAMGRGDLGGLPGKVSMDISGNEQEAGWKPKIFLQAW